MRIKELIKELEKFDEDSEVFINDNEYWWQECNTVYWEKKEAMFEWERWFRMDVILEFNPPKNEIN